MDVGAVYAYAEGFSSAVVIDDRDLIATYLRDPLKGDFTIVLDALSGPLEDSEILTVTPFGPSDFCCSEPEEYVSLTRFSGLQEEVLLRAIWSENPHELVMRKAQVVERKARVGQEENPHELMMRKAQVVERKARVGQEEKFSRPGESYRRIMSFSGVSPHSGRWKAGD